MTKQEIFDKVVTHLRQQGRRSLDPSHKCAYKAANGDSCAVGCLISAEHYTSQIEGKSAQAPEVQKILKKSGVPVDFDILVLLEHLQRVHDAIEPANWERDLQNVALQRGLQYTPPATIRSIDVIEALGPKFAEPWTFPIAKTQADLPSDGVIIGSGYTEDDDV